jgi:hypothetical protein
MPLSNAARAAVFATTKGNPRMAQWLLDLLRIAPEAVKRKWRDPYGPLAALLASRPAPGPRLDRLCRTFQREWLEERFTVVELAAALEDALREVTGSETDTRRYRRNGWRTLAGRDRAPDRLLGDPRA